MQFQLLGDFQASEGGRPVQVKSMQVRALLVTLLLAPGQRAPHGYLETRLWPHGGYHPTNVRSCCRKLRRLFPGVMPDANEPNYCRIHVDRESVDYFRFQDALARARDQRGADQIGPLRDALAEWKGDPLRGIAGADLSEEKRRLDREWREATVLLLRAYFDDKDGRSFNSGLRVARKRWPDDGAIFSLELRSLARDKKLSQVRERFQKWTKEWGTPSVRLGRLVDELTRSDATSAPTSVPRQLPAPRHSLAGRQDELHELSEALLTDGRGGVRLAVVTGMAGVGKTQLAQYWAASVEDGFPDGTLYVDLNGYPAQGSPEEPAQILGRLLNDLGIEPRTPTIDGMSTAYRTELAHRKVIVLLDNARDVHQVRPLLPGVGSCVAIVTSRDRLVQMIVREQAHEVRLGPLGHADAVTLLTEALGAAWMRAGADHISEIVELCGGLPLALSVVAAKSRSRSPEAIKEMTRTLRERRTRLDSLGYRSGEPNVRAALGSSHDMLSLAAADLFARLAIHPGPTISRREVVCLAEGSRALAVDELIDANLLEEPTPDRFAFHDLVRLYATERAEALPREEHERVHHRMLDSILQNAWACDRVLAPGRRLPIDEPRDIEVVAPATPREAMAWLHAEYATVTAVIRQSHARGDDRYTWLLSMVLTTYQWRAHRYADAVRYLTYAAAGAERVADPVDHAMVHRMLAGSRRGLGELDQAREDLRRAISLSEMAGDPLGVAHGRHLLGLLHRESGEAQVATELFESALSTYRRLGDRLGEAGALRGLGTARFDLGDHEGALRRGEEALRLFLTTADLNSQASTLMDLGRLHVARLDRHSALESFSAAAERYAGLEYPHREASALVEMSEVLNTLNRVEESRSALQRAAVLLRDVDPVAADEAQARLAVLPMVP